MEKLVDKCKNSIELAEAMKKEFYGLFQPAHMMDNMLQMPGAYVEAVECGNLEFAQTIADISEQGADSILSYFSLMMLSDKFLENEASQHRLRCYSRSQGYRCEDCLMPEDSTCPPSQYIPRQEQHVLTFG
jgi:hypothetical protein